MRYIFLLIVFQLHIQVYAQDTKNIKGRVLSMDNHLPLSGASITIVGSHVNSITDKEGLFRIEVLQGQVLLISHAEYETRHILVDTIGKNKFDVYLHSKSKTLAGIIINTGYQKIDIQRSTGSFVKIDSTLITRSTSSNILSRLEGVTPSLYMDHKNQDAPLQIRGISTLGYASTSPLIILNNFPYEGDISDLNPDDIESISILRDAAASSIWGARAGNGVIVITTKEGSLNQQSRISFTSNVIFTPNPNLFTNNAISSSDYIYVEKFLFQNGFYDNSVNNPFDYDPVSPVVDILSKERNGIISENEAGQKLALLAKKDVRRDFEKYIYRQGVSQQYNLSISAGGARSTHYISVGYNKELSNLIGNQSDRATFRISESLKPLKNFELNVGINYTHRDFQDNNQLAYGQISIMGTSKTLYPYSQLADSEGNPLPIDAYFKSSFTDTAGNGLLLNWKYRPLDELKFTDNITRSNSLLAEIGMKYQVTSTLNAEIKYQYQSNNNQNKDFRSVQSFEARNLINLFTQQENGILKYIVPVGGILDSKYGSGEGYNLRTQLNFAKQLNNESRLTIIAGGEIRSLKNELSADRVYGYDNNLNFTPVDFKNYYPTFDNVLGGYLYIPPGTSFSSTQDNYLSLYSNGIFIYKNLYMLSGSYRYDASNLFGVKANQKGTPLWSLGTAMNISRAEWYHVRWLSYLKLRLSYGISGNVSHTVSALTTLIYGSASDQPNTRLPYAYVNNFPNAHLQWEKVRVLNLGADFATLNQRLSGSIDVYAKKSSDVLAPQDLDPTVGTLQLYTNSANLMGHGLDVKVKSENIVSKKINWTTDFFISYSKMKVTKLLYKGFTTDGFVSDGLNITPIEGYEPYQIISFKWAGLNQEGEPQGYVNGKASTDYDSLLSTPLSQQVINGSALPHAFGSILNSFELNHFSVSFNITYKFGYYFRKPSLSYYDLYYNGTGIKEFADRWKNPGDELNTNVPAMIYPYNSKSNDFYQYADVNVLKGDNIKLSDIRLGYVLTPKYRNIFFKGSEIFMYISNLNFQIWRANKAGIDPDNPGGIRTPISISFGLRTNF